MRTRDERWELLQNCRKNMLQFRCYTGDTVESRSDGVLESNEP